MNVPRSTDGGGVSPAPGITAGVGRGRGSRPRSLVRGQLIVLGLPLAAQRGQEVVRLYRGRVVAEGVCGGERAGEVHEDGPRAEDHVAVALAVHARLVPRAQHAALAVAQRGVRGLGLGLPVRRRQQRDDGVRGELQQDVVQQDLQHLLPVRERGQGQVPEDQGGVRDGADGRQSRRGESCHQPQ